MVEAFLVAMLQVLEMAEGLTRTEKPGVQQVFPEGVVVLPKNAQTHREALHRMLAGGSNEDAVRLFGIARAAHRQL